MHSKPLTEGRRGGGDIHRFVNAEKVFQLQQEEGKEEVEGGFSSELESRARRHFRPLSLLSVVYIALTELFLDPSSSGYGKKGTIGEKGIIGGNICACLPFPHCSYVRMYMH